jgi:positive regulator of sigma E activity
MPTIPGPLQRYLASLVGILIATSLIGLLSGSTLSDWLRMTLCLAVGWTIGTLFTMRITKS